MAIDPKLNAYLKDAVRQALDNNNLDACYIFSRTSTRGEQYRNLTASAIYLKGFGLTPSPEQLREFVRSVTAGLDGYATFDKAVTQNNEHGDGRGGSMGKSPTVIITVKLQ